MIYNSAIYKIYREARVAGGFFAVALLASTLATAQDRDRDRDRSQDRNAYSDRMTRLEPGTVIPVRTNDAIDADRRDNQVYTGIVAQDVRGNNGRVAIPRGANVELIVRVERDNDLIIDLESVMVNGQRYAVRTDANRVGSQRDDSLIGGIVGAISGAEARGRAVRIPRDSVVTFRLQRPLDMGVADRGSTRDGRHYHDYYERQDRN
jgi:hypothetical protein